MADAIPQHVHCNVTASLFVHLNDSVRYAKQVIILPFRNIIHIIMLFV